MSLRPTAMIQEHGGAEGLYVVIDDPDTEGVLLIPASFEHRRIVTRGELADGNRFEVHPARPVPTNTSELDRWTVSRDLPEGVEPDSLGALVKFEDALAILLRAEKAEAELAQLEEEIDKARDFAEEHPELATHPTKETYTREQLLGDEAMDAAGSVRIETTYPFRTVDRQHRREVIEAACDALDKGKGGEDV